MLDKFNKLMRNKILITSILGMNIAIFIVGLVLSDLGLLFISTGSYATVLISSYIGRSNDEQE